MPMADGDYKRRLLESIMSRQKAGREAAFAKSKPMPDMVKPEYGLIPFGPLDRFAERQATDTNRGRLAGMMDPSMRLLYGSTDMPKFEPPVGGVGSVARRATLAALRSKALQDAFKSAEELAGAKFADEVIGQGTMKASDMPRYSRAGGQKLLDFIQEQLDSGAMDVKSANRFVRAFPEYVKGSGADAAYEIVGRNARAFEDLTTKADDALLEMQFAKEGLSNGTRKYGPKTLVEYLLSKLPEAQSRVSSVLDEWH